MQEREVASRVALGEIQTIAIRRDTQRVGWVAIVPGPQGDSLLETKRGRDIRLFKTSDAVLRWCERIGIRETTIYL